LHNEINLLRLKTILVGSIFYYFDSIWCTCQTSIKEEGANLHHDEEHQDYDFGEHYNEDNNRWAWMQTKVQRISTEQQR